MFTSTFPEEFSEMGEPIWGVLLIFVFFAIMLLPTIFFLITLQKTLERCSEESRTMPSGQVWLQLIPFFGLVWKFINVSNVASSLDNEFKRRNIVAEEMPGKTIGITYCVLSVCGIIPCLGIIASIAALICWIIYWVKIDEYSSMLVR